MVIGSSMKTSVAYTIDNSTTKSTTASLAAGGKYTADGLSASSVTFYCMGTKSSSRLYVNYLSVTYEGGSGKTPTTFAFTNNQTSFNYNVGDNDGLVELTNPAVLTPAEAGTISYSIENSTFDEGEIDVDETGEVMFSTDKAASATITATVSGIDETKYVAPASTTISYTVNVSKVKTQTTLSFGEAYDGKTISAELDDAFTAPTATLAPAVEGATIKYSSSTPSVATVDETTGAVTLVGKGTTTITATYEGNDDYAASEASYTLNVTKTVAVEDGVFDFTGDGTIDYGSGLVPSKDNTFITATTKFVAGNVILTTNLAKGTGFRWWIANGGNELRFYGKTNFSNFTLSVPEGYVITNIVFTGDAFQVDEGTLKSKTWSGASNAVTFTPTKSGNGIQTITVKYVKTETLTTSAKGYATYAATYNVNYSEQGLTAYTITVNDEQTEVLAKEFTGVVPAGRAVLVKGEAAKEYVLTPAIDVADGTFATALQTGATTADGTQYGFTSAGDVPAFKKVTVGQSIAAKKGYLVLTSADAAAKLNLNFGGEATGIKAIEDATAGNAAIYNLAGQRVDKAYKGIVIVNGKKYLNK